MQKKEIAPIIPPKDMILGSPEASVLLTVYGDYESIETRKLNEIVMELLTTFNGKLKFSFRHFTLTQLNQRSNKAAEAVIAAGQEVKYWDMHLFVLDKQKALGII
jgi:protein-disulfide isomerase